MPTVVRRPFEPGTPGARAGRDRAARAAAQGGNDALLTFSALFTFKSAASFALARSNSAAEQGRQAHSPRAAPLPRLARSVFNRRALRELGRLLLVQVELPGKKP